MPTTGDFSLVQLRTALGLPQAEMARRMGLSLRPYQELSRKFGQPAVGTFVSRS